MSMDPQLLNSTTRRWCCSCCSRRRRCRESTRPPTARRDDRLRPPPGFGHGIPDLPLHHVHERVRGGRDRRQSAPRHADDNALIEGCGAQPRLGRLSRRRRRARSPKPGAARLARGHQPARPCSRWRTSRQRRGHHWAESTVIPLRGAATNNECTARTARRREWPAQPI